jgi:serine/threonine protein kinase
VTSVAQASTGRFCPRCGARGEGARCERDDEVMVEPPEGTLLGSTVGNYVLVQLLGEGGMGGVYRGIHPEIGAEVAIKVLHDPAVADGEDARRFLLEAQTVNRVRHRNLVRILDSGYLPGRRPYLVMELLDGVALSDLVGQLGPEAACAIAAEALDALAEVHATGVVHRDLKPANVFVCRDGRVVVLDFGIAKLIRADASATQSNAMIGTPAYMAPEQIRANAVDARTDVYAMGVLLYEATTGRRPFDGPSTFEILSKHVDAAPPAPRSWRPQLAPAIEQVILRAMAKAPAARFQTAAEMAAAARAAGGDQVSAAELGTIAASRRPPSRPAITLARSDRAPAPAPAPATVPSRPRPSPAPAPTDPAVAAAPVVTAGRPGRWRLVAAVAGLVAAGALAGVVAWAVRTNRSAPAADTTVDAAAPTSVDAAAPMSVDATAPTSVDAAAPTGVDAGRRTGDAAGRTRPGRDASMRPASGDPRALDVGGSEAQPDPPEQDPADGTAAETGPRPPIDAPGPRRDARRLDNPYPR